jgi:uncharacterized membrane protein
MFGRVQRRPDAAAPASEHLRFGRDASLALAGVALVLCLPGLITGSRGGTLLALTAAACVFSAAWFWILAAYFKRREPTAPARPAATTAQSKRLLGDWMFSVAMFPFATAVAVVEGSVSDLVWVASLAGFTMAAARLAMYRYAPESVTMRERDRAQIAWLLKLTMVAAVVGFVAVIAIAIGGGDTWAPIWPGLALGLLCGTVSLVQLARATARMST